jgi:hypothetical protein
MYLHPYLPTRHQACFVQQNTTVGGSNIVMVHCSCDLHLQMNAANGLGMVVHKQFQSHRPAIEEACIHKTPQCDFSKKLEARLPIS